MIYIVAIVLGILIGLISGGKMSNLLDMKLEKKAFIMAAFIIQIGAQILSVSEKFSFLKDYSVLITGASFCLLLIGFWFNRHYLGVCFIGLGALLNIVVMMFNNGRMPVSETLITNEALKSTLADSSKHMIANGSTKLNFLADIIAMPSFLGAGAKVLSVGDAVVGFGILILMAEMLASRGLVKHYLDKILKRV